MASFSPLKNLLKIMGKDDEEELGNIYDDGSVWTKPSNTTMENKYISPIQYKDNSPSLGLKNITGSAIQETVDPLQNPRNQINYYTNELNELGQEVKKPSILDKVASGFTRLGAVTGVLSNTFAGGVDRSLELSREEYDKISNSEKGKKIKDMGFEIELKDGLWQIKHYTDEDGFWSIKGASAKEGYSEASKLLDEAVSENGKSPIDKIKDEVSVITSGLKSGANTISGLWTGKYSDKNVDWGKVLENNRINPNEKVTNLVKMVESPGYYGYKMFTAPADNKWDWSGADEETAKAWGNIVGDLIVSIPEGNLFTDIDGAGKTIKALRKGGKLDDIAKVNKLDDALNLAKKYNSYDDYVSSLGEKASKYSDEALEGMYNKSLNTYAQDLMKDVNKGLGGINNYDGLKLGQKTILTPEQVSNISKNKLQSSLLQVGLGLYSPVGAIMSNPVIDGANKLIDKTEVGKALKKDLNKAFSGGKNNEWINSMKNNPEKALDYANERKQVDLAKKMSDNRVQEVMDTIHKYSDMKETPEELTKIIEEPTTRKTRMVEVEREINNPEYISKMMKLGKNEYNKQVSSIKTLQNKLKAQKDELLKVAKKDATQSSSELVAGIDSEINNLQKRLDKIESVKGAKSLDFNKQMKKFGYEDDYTEMFDKAISTNIKTLTKEVGDRDLAEAMQESANRVLDQLDKQFPGLSEHFTSYTKIDKNKVVSGATDNFEGEDLIDKAKELNIKIDGEKLRTDEKYRKSVEKSIQVKANDQKAWSDFSKNNKIYSGGSGDVVEDMLDRAYKRRSGVDTEVLKYSDEYRAKLDELEDLKRPRTEIEMEMETPETKKARNKKIRELTSYLRDSEMSSIESGGKLSSMGEYYNEANSKATQEVQQLTLKLNKKELDKYDNAKKLVKNEELVGTGYLEKESARKLAPRLKEELGLKESIAQIKKGLMLDGAEYVESLKQKVYRNHFDTTMNLSDDEFDIIKRQLDRRAESDVKLPWKESQYIRAEKEIKNMDIDDTLKPTDKNITSVGKNRDTFVDALEEERFKAKKPQEYMGTEYDGKTVKALEKLDKQRASESVKNQIIYDKMVKLHGKEKGSKIYNEYMEKKAKQEAEKLNSLLKRQENIKKIEKQNRLNSSQEALQEVAVSSDKIVPLNGKNVLGKTIKAELPDDIKDMVGIKLNTASGEIIIDNKLKTSELENILSNRKYGKGEEGSRIIYTNTRYKNSSAIASYVPKNDTVIINLNGLNKNQAQTILEHELGHRVFRKINQKYPNIAPSLLIKPFMDFVKNLPDDKKLDFIDIVGMANKTNAPTKEMLDVGIVTRYLNLYSKAVKNEFKVSNEAFAELFSLYNNKNSKIANKMKSLNQDAYEGFMFRIEQLPKKEVKNISSLARKRFGDDYANQILELKNKKEAVTRMGKIHEVMEKASDINKTTIEIKDLEKDLKNLELSMDKHEFDDNGNIISTDYDTFFDEMKKRNPKAVADIDKKIPQYKTLRNLEEKVFEIDNTKALTPEAREYMDKFKASMKDIAIREGIYDEENAEYFTTYVMHMINPKYSDDADIIEKGRLLKEELKDPLNVHALSRKKEGTIQELNAKSEAEVGRRIFEENINRLFLKRAVDSEKTVTKKSMNDRILEQFSIPIIRDFEEAVNKSDHLMDNYGDELVSALGMSKKQVKELYEQSEKTSFEFVKDILYDDFVKSIPKYENMTLDKFMDFLSLNKYDEYHTEKAMKFFEEKKYKVVNDILFQGKYSMTNKFGYARSFRYKYGYDNYLQESPLENIPLKTEDGRPYVFEAKKDDKGNKIESKVDRTKEMPYDIEGQEPDPWNNEIKAYTEFVYKEAKNRNMIIVELPKEAPETVVKRTISNKAMEEAMKDRTNLAETISKLMTGDKEAIEGFDVLAGYNVIDPKKISYEEFNVDSGTKKILVDRNAWDNYQKAIKDAQYKEKNALLKVYDYMNSIFKSQALFSVGFHVRNGIQNVIASYVKTGTNLLDPKKNKKALEMMLYKKGKLKNLDVTYGGYNVDEILREAEMGGIFETEVKNLFDKDKTKEFLEGKSDKLAKKKYSLGQTVNPFGTDFIGYRASNALGGGIEEQAKLINIISHLESGMNLSDAIHLTKETLFDYSDLTQFEAKVMKRIMPFYTFMRKNIPSQIDNLANHGARFNRIEGITQKASEKNETDRERALRPDYLDGQLALGNQKYINLGNASADLKKLVNPLEMGSGLNPIIKTPIELIFNKQMYSGSDISKYDKPTEKLKYTVESSIPITKQVSALHKLITGTEVEQSKAQKTLSRVAGNMINSYDIDKQEKATMYDYIEELQNQYYEYLEKNPEAKAQVEAEANKAKSKAYESPISKLIKKQR